MWSFAHNCHSRGYHTTGTVTLSQQREALPVIDWHVRARSYIDVLPGGGSESGIHQHFQRSGGVVVAAVCQAPRSASDVLG